MCLTTPCGLVGAAVQVVLVPRVGEYEDIVGNMAHLEEDGVSRDEELLTCGQRTAWGLSFADVAVVVSKPTEGLAEKMIFTVNVRPQTSPIRNKKQ